MGWSGGSDLMWQFMEDIQNGPYQFSHHQRCFIYRALIPILENMDCDTLCELLDSGDCDSAFKEAMTLCGGLEEE